ncbi:MAG TPA: hypothetical protein VJ837_01370 [Candidatus Paceibacterota bacterium]|nr:hypothetical protein [Candidatus Paceibacterota bacterium]
MKHTLGTILLFIIGVGILGGIARFVYQAVGPDSQYKAVLLTSGDVYFARVSDGFGRYVTLRDVFYPQIPQAPEGQQPEVRLVKFGGEIHGPEDEIKVSREHIIMIQPLRADSQVIATIEQYEDQ